MADPTVIDPQAIEALRSLSPDDTGFMKELIDIYLQDTPARIAEVETSLANKDANTLLRAAHTIKGSSANFGARTFVKMALEIESHAKTANLEAAASLVPAFKEEYARVSAALVQIANQA
ncbi:Hpt domain-containing protein [Oleiharenicola lentus]|uniref:Hpt domain-containing protein n=1 Tax=Oleiharenicola lentus TaxID=2508720 RepID=UPI003F67443F